MLNILKKIVYCILTAVLILSTLSLVIFTANEAPTPSYTVPGDQLDRYVVVPELISGKMGCEFCTRETVCAECMSENVRPFFKIDVTDLKFTTFVVTFHEKIPNGIYFKIFFDEGAGFHKDQYKFGSSVEGNDTLVFSAALPKSTTMLYLDAFGEYTVKDVTFYDISEKNVSLSFNPIGAIVLLTTLALAACFEWKLRYFSWLISLVKREIDYCKVLYCGEKRPLFWLHVVNLTVTSVFLLLTAMFLIFNHFYNASIIGIFFLCLATVVLQLADRIISGRGKEIATMFLTLTLLMGIMVCAITPPRTNTAWDDSIHLRQSYTLVLGNHDFSLGKYKYFSDGYTFGTYITDPYQFTRRIAAEDAIPLDFTTPTDNPTNLLGHLPTAAAVLPATLLRFDLIKLTVVCRLANLITYAAILYFALKKLKRGGLIFSAVCMLSCPLFLACSFKADYWMIAWLAYGFATIFSIYQSDERRFTPQELCKILVAFFLACTPKMIYCVILLPLLFLDKSKFKDPRDLKRFRIATVATIALLLALIVIPGLFNNFYTDGRGGTEVNSLGQILYILKNPFAFLTTLSRFLINLFSVYEFHEWNTTFGYGFLGAPGAWHTTVALFLLIFALLLDRSKEENVASSDKTEHLFKWITLASCLLTVIAITASMYVGFNGVGSTEITGVQFRYLFPLFLPFFYYIAPRKPLLATNERVRDAVLFGGLALNFLIGFVEAYLQYFMY